MNKSKAIFLDRDGVLNTKKDNYVKKISELEIFPFISEPIKKLQKEGFKIIVITNQSAINRGLMNGDDLDKIHEKIQSFLIKNGTKIDDFYHCPHTPSENCFCRKPNPGLLLRAIDDFSIDVNQSWFLGDSDSDMLVGKIAGCKTIRINNEVSLEHAVKLILKNN
jgi:D-glycero-D-manno-heptose 1,7-bisphosphate phosphatase